MAPQEQNMGSTEVESLAPCDALARVVVAGLAGDTGKSLVSLGLIRSCKAQGLVVAPFKKGPDFIDAAWLGAAAGSDGHNLDTFMMEKDAILGSVARAQGNVDIAIVEGNRGLFDGLDADGSHSTAELAKMIGASVILVIDVTKMTRTTAALVAGCRALDEELNLAGVVLNRVGTSRQESIIRQAVAQVGVPVVGAIPKLKGIDLPSRHLGLIPAAERDRAEEILAGIGEAVGPHLDLDQIRQIASRAESVQFVQPSRPPVAKTVRIGVLKDKAFSFYYPENLEALEAAGAEVVFISPLEDETLPTVDALYAGGGFPEEYAAPLSQNDALKKALKKAITDGMPVWAECGGLMYLSRAIECDGKTHEMVGAIPVVVEQTARPQGHGYVRARVDGDNPFFSTNSELRGHEFHYSRLKTNNEQVPTVMALEKGVGVGGKRDGIRVGSLVASFTHLHALGAPNWAPGFVRAAREAELRLTADS